MKIGMRKPSIKKMLKARTTGKAKRLIKKKQSIRFMVKKVWDLLKIQKNQLEIPFIIKLHLVFGICSNKM